MSQNSRQLCQSLQQDLQASPHRGTRPPDRHCVPSTVLSHTLHTVTYSDVHLPSWGGQNHCLRVALPGQRRVRVRGGLFCLLTVRVALIRPQVFSNHYQSHLCLDFVTRLTPSNNKTGVLSVMDSFSRSAHFMALAKLPSASETANLNIQTSWHSSWNAFDCRPQFISQVCRTFCTALWAKACFSLNFPPQTADEESAVPTVQHHLQRRRRVWEQTRTSSLVECWRHSYLCKKLAPHYIGLCEIEPVLIAPQQ